MKKKTWIAAVCLFVSAIICFGCIHIRDRMDAANVPVSEAAGTAASGDVIQRQTTTTATASQTKSTVAGTDSTTATTTTTPTTVNGVPRTDFSFSDTQTNTLSTMLKNYGGQASAIYMDIETGYTYRYNTDHRYFAASLIKAPFCLYIMQQAADGKCDLSKKLTYTQAFKAGGTGIIQKSAFGSTYSLQTLVEYAIRYSDNVALRMLRSEFPADGFKKFAASIGIKNTQAIGVITNSTITAEDALIYMQAVNKFITTDQTYGKLLYEYMTHTGNKMFTSTYPLVRKYGWADASFHEMAIVEAPHPYILILCTDHEDGNANDFAMFRKFSSTVENFAA